MNLLRTVVAFCAASLFWTASASAKDRYFQCSTQVSNGAITTVYSSGIFLAPMSSYAAQEYAEEYKQFLIGRGLNASYAGCSASDTNKDAFKWLGYFEDNARKQNARFQVVGWASANGRIVRNGDPDPVQVTARESKGKTASSGSSGDKGKTGSSGLESRSDPPKAPIKTKADYEAEYQARLEKYEAEKKAWADKVAAQKAEEERKKAAHAAAQQAAAKAKADHAAKMSMFERVLEEQRQRQRDYEAALVLNNRCRDGDKQACADIKAGRTAAPEDKVAATKDPGKAATSDDDARMCVTEPTLGPSTVWKDALAATVVNGCKTAVDVRLCLLREGGWNCGVNWGLQPQERWSWTSFKATGEVFWDARIRGTGRALASPE